MSWGSSVSKKVSIPAGEMELDQNEFDLLSGGAFSRGGGSLGYQAIDLQFGGQPPMTSEQVSAIHASFPRQEDMPADYNRIELSQYPTGGGQAGPTWSMGRDYKSLLESAQYVVGGVGSSIRGFANTLVEKVAPWGLLSLMSTITSYGYVGQWPKATQEQEEIKYDTWSKQQAYYVLRDAMSGAGVTPLTPQEWESMNYPTFSQLQPSVAPFVEKPYTVPVSTIVGGDVGLAAYADRAGLVNPKTVNVGGVVYTLGTNAISRGTSVAAINTGQSVYDSALAQGIYLTKQLSELRAQESYEARAASQLRVQAMYENVTPQLLSYELSAKKGYAATSWEALATQQERTRTQAQYTRYAAEMVRTQEEASRTQYQYTMRAVEGVKTQKEMTDYYKALEYRTLNPYGKYTAQVQGDYAKMTYFNALNAQQSYMYTKLRYEAYQQDLWLQSTDEGYVRGIEMGNRRPITGYKTSYQKVRGRMRKVRTPVYGKSYQVVEKYSGSNPYDDPYTYVYS